MSGQTFSTFTEVGMIDARLKTGIITLPTTTSIPYRILTLKDVYGATSFSTVTISTQTGDAFEDGTTTRSINAAWGMTTLYAGKAGTWYTIGGSILTTASISSLTVSSIFGLTNFVSTPYLATQLASTVIGLGTAGYLSSIPSLGGFVSTANLANLVSTANLANLVSTANLANLVSTANLANLVSTANLANLVSTANLANHISTANLANMVSTANLANLVSTTYLATQLGSTVRGLGTAGYLSTINYSTVVLSSLTAQNLTSVQGYISSLTVDSLFLGSNSAFVDMGDVIATSLSTIQINVGTQFAVTISAQQLFVSSIQATNIIGALTTANLTSTVIGLGTAGYLSSAITNVGGFGFISTANLANLVSTANLAGHISTANLANLVSTTYLATQLGSTVIGLGTAGYISTIIFGPIVSTHNLANLVSTANLANLVSTANLASLVSTSYLQTQLGSTVIGLGTAGYISSSQLLSTTAGLNQYISSFIDPVELTSTVIGLGTAGFVSSLGLTYAVASTAQGLGTFGYTSTSQLLSTSLGLYQEIQNSPANIKQSNVTSTIIGLGTFGYLSTVVFGSVVSTANLANLVSTANLANLVSTANLANHVSTANLANLVSTTYLATQLGSTVRGLGTAGYLSSINYSTVVLSSLTAQNLTSVQGYISSLVVDSLQLGSNTAYIYMGDVIATSLSTVYVAAGSATIISLSAQQLYVSSIQATNIIGSLTTANLTSTVIGLGTVGYISTGLGGFSFVSTANLANLVSTANLANLVSTANLANLVSTANLANVVSTANLANHISTANLANLVSTTYLATQLGSTVIGLGTAGYISSAQLLSTTFGYSQNFTTQNASISSLRFSTATANNAYISSLNIDQLTFGDGNGWADFGALRALAISTLVVNTGILYATTVSTSQLIGVNFLVQSNLTSTVIGLGTAGYLSSVTAANLANLVSTANLANLVSTANLANLVSTANLANLVSTANLANLVSTANLVNLVSTANLAGHISTANLAGHISTANLANLISTTYLSTQLGSTFAVLNVSSFSTFSFTGITGFMSTLTVNNLFIGSNQGFTTMGDVIGTSLSTILLYTGVEYATNIYASSLAVSSIQSYSNQVNILSAQQLYVSSIQATNIIGALTTANLTSTVIGLGTAGYISSSQLLSTSAGLSQYISSFIDPTELTSTVIGLGTAGFVSSLGLTYAVASTAQGLGTFGYTSTSQLLSTSLGLYQQIQASATTITQPVLTSTIIGLGTLGYLSTIVLGSVVSTANLANLVSTANLANFVSTTYLATQLGSTVRGLGTAGYLSSINYSTVVLSSLTAQNLTSVQGYISSLTVDAFYLGSNSAFFNMGDVIATSLSTIQINVGTQFAVSISAQQLYVSSIQATNIIGALTTANLTSTVIGLGTAGYISSIPSIGGFVSTANLANLVSTANLANLVSTANLANHISTANLANLVSTANLANLVSTSYLATQIGSTVIGLGTAGYVSTSQLLSTTFGLNLFISSFYVDHPELLSTVAGLGTLGYLSTGFSTLISRNFLTSSLSTVNINTANVNSLTATISSLTVNALFIGTGTGFTDTGDTIGTSMSTITITANSITAITLSTQQLNVSSITGISLLSQTNLTSTIIGLGTTGYVSSSQLLSTSAGLSQYISSFIDPTELTSTVIGLGTAGFVSSLGLTYAVASTAQGLGTFGYTSTSQLLSTSLGLYQEIQNSPVNIKQSNVTSTIIGLGTFGYLSTVVFGSIVSTANLANLVSTANLANLVSTANLANLVSTANLANLVSTANLANLVSTANLANLVSTANLANHISTANLANFVSTTYLSTQLGSTFATLNVSSLSTFSLQGTTAFISSLTVNGLFIGSNQGFVNMGDVIATSVSSLVVYAGGMFSTSNSSQQTFLSSINGVSFANIGSGGIAGIPSSLNTSSISTFSLTGTTAFISSLTVNGLFIGSNQGFVNMGDIIATSLSSLVIYTGSAFATSNQASITSTQQLNISSINGQTFGGPITSTVIGLGTTGYLSTIVFGSIVSTANLANHISTANLANLVSTANLANLVSTANLANHISTANLANLVSTTYIATQLGSTVIGLGTVGYISSAQFLSSFNGISLNFRTSSINTNNLSAGTTYVSSMVINTLQIGLTPGFIQMGDIITTSVSTILTTTNLLNAGINAISSFNVYGGTNQSGLGLRFFGSSIQSPLGQPASMSVSSVSTYTTMYLGTFDQYAPGRGASLGFGANNSNGLQTLQGRITGTPTTNTVSGGDQGTLNFEVNDSGRMFNTMTMWAIGGQGRVGINCNSPSFNFDLNGTMRVTSTTTFSSNVLLTGGVTSFMSNSGLFSNVATATFASNVLHTGGLTSFMSNSGLFSNVGQATFTGGVNIVASALTASNSSSPVIFSNATSAANSVIKCEMGGANFIIRQAVNAGSATVIENTGSGALLINPLGASVSIGSSNNSYMLDVAGIARSGIPVSSLTGTSATFGANAFGIYYYITNSAFSNIGLYNTSGGATGTGGTAPPIGTGWYVTLRNNTGSYLSITVNGLLVSTPASPFTIPPSNSVTIAYDANLAGGAGYVFF